MKLNQPTYSPKNPKGRRIRCNEASVTRCWNAQVLWKLRSTDLESQKSSSFIALPKTKVKAAINKSRCASPWPMTNPREEDGPCFVHASSSGELPK